MSDKVSKRESYADENDRPEVDQQVEVPFGDNAGERATLLLAAAEESGHGSAVVRTTGTGFIVPSDVAEAANVEGENVTDRANQLRLADPEQPPEETIKGGAGPTGEVDTNAGENAESGTVIDQAAESDAPRSDIEFVNQKQQEQQQQQADDSDQPKRRRTSKKAAEKDPAKEKQE